MKEFGGNLELIEGWAPNVLKNMVWLKRKGTTGKVEPCAKFLEKEKCLFQRAISKFVSEHDIPLDLVLNLDQTPVFYVLLYEYTFYLKGSTTVPIKGANDKQQINATFTVSAPGSFLPIQPIYNGKTKRFLPKYDFPNCFDVKFTLNHWFSFQKCVSLFEKLSFSVLKRRKKNLVTQRNKEYFRDSGTGVFL